MMLLTIQETARVLIDDKVSDLVTAGSMVGLLMILAVLILTRRHPARGRPR